MFIKAKMTKKRQYNEENLKKGVRFSSENQPSPEAKRKGHQKKKTMREMLDYLLSKEITNKQGEKATTLEALMVATIKKAMSGDTRAVQFIRDTIGEMPTQKIENTGTQIQKVFITPQEKASTDKHIDEVINGDNNGR